MVPVHVKTSSAELYVADRDVIIEHLQKEKEGITDLFDRFTIIQTGLDNLNFDLPRSHS